ncbi:MAG: PGF-pre-PGF domain-containing protein [Candidatus Methanoperedens sp.]|nr:PGF-pre-PGF domain-containing protein [Candidatus Methanoperedens sp.]
MVNKKNSKGSFIASALITIFIVAMLIISGPASAVIVKIVGLDGASITSGDSKIFDINVTLENPDKFVPISDFSLNISKSGTTVKQCKFDTAGNKLSPCDAAITNVSAIAAPSASHFGNGSGYGWDNYSSGYGFGYNFSQGYGWKGFGYGYGNGYGYGYSYGAGGGDVTFVYRITLSTSGMATGTDYTAKAYLNTGNDALTYFASSEASFTIAAASTSGSGGSSSGGSSGGGGGGGASGENFSNIEAKERYELQIFKDKTTTYSFKNASNPVTYVKITGNVSAGSTTVTAEVLKSTSTLVKTAPSGTVYKNVNIWVGTSGFATSKNIKDAIIGFRIDNSWLTNNGISVSDVKLLKWDGTQWIQLETTVIGKQDSYTVFEGKTTSFSPFAISAKVSEIAPVKTPGVTQPSGTTTPEVPPGTTTKGTTESTGSSIWTYLILAVGIVLVVAIAIKYDLLNKIKEMQNKKE